MVERVALALWQDRHPDHGWNDIGKINYEGHARAAIEAMRKPTEEMINAGARAISDCYSLDTGEGFDNPPAPAAYEAMINEALR